jgi:hypothetical protein
MLISQHASYTAVSVTVFFSLIQRINGSALCKGGELITIRKAQLLSLLDLVVPSSAEEKLPCL